MVRWDCVTATVKHRCGCWDRIVAGPFARAVRVVACKIAPPARGRQQQRQRQQPHFYYYYYYCKHNDHDDIEKQEEGGDTDGALQKEGEGAALL